MIGFFLFFFFFFFEQVIGFFHFLLFNSSYVYVLSQTLFCENQSLYFMVRFGYLIGFFFQLNESHHISQDETEHCVLLIKPSETKA